MKPLAGGSTLWAPTLIGEIERGDIGYISVDTLAGKRYATKEKYVELKTE
jgi:hypothetical protein